MSEESAPRIRVVRWPSLVTSGLLGSRLGSPTARPSRTRWDLTDLLRLCERYDLRGRGGSGFPLALKLSAVHNEALVQGRATRLVVNGEEGEPASLKDRTLMLLRPDLVLDGAEIVADCLEATQIHLYVSDPTCRDKLASHLASRRDADRFVLFDAPAGYVSGEESAVVRALSGGPAKPTAKPPRPFQKGVDGDPTLVSNVETLAQLARLVRAEEEGTPPDGEVAATVLLTVSSDCGDRYVAEVPTGASLREILEWLSLWPPVGTPTVLLGGFFGGFASSRAFDVPLTHDAVRETGNSLGCGIVVVLKQTCPTTATSEILGYLDAENAQQCGPCFRGIPAMHEAVVSVADGDGKREHLDRLANWAQSLRGRGDCGTLDAACGLVASLMTQHESLLEDHLGKPCARCAERRTPPRSTSFAMPWPIQLEELP
jgi:NADH:ubiquinone oxidoreductase subunit F (NADH-binding)